MKKTTITAAALAALLVLSPTRVLCFEIGVPDAFYVITGFSDAAETAATEGKTPEFSLDAAAVQLTDAKTGTVLYGLNADEKRPIASITKVMTMILVAEALESKKISLDDDVTTSEHAYEMGGSQIWLEPGEVMTVDELLRAVAVASANDAAVALAEFVSGTEDGFVSEMNKRAAELGMNDTVFKNANGLDEEGHVSSARDVAAMSRELLSHELIRPYISTWMDELRGGETQLVNTNNLLKSYQNVTGIKTGTTDDAGVCIAVSAVREDMELIAVILGSSSKNGRTAAAKALLDYGFSNFELAKPSVPDSALTPVRARFGVQEYCEYDAIVPEHIVVGKGEKAAVSCEVTLPETVDAPVEKGQKLGEITVYVNGAGMNRYDITAKESIKRITFGLALKKLVNELISM